MGIEWDNFITSVISIITIKSISLYSGVIALDSGVIALDSWGRGAPAAG